MGQNSTGQSKATHGGFASLGMKLGDEALLLEESQRVVAVVGTCQVHLQPITSTAMMLTDKGDDGDAEKSDELEAIDCLTRV